MCGIGRRLIMFKFELLTKEQIGELYRTLTLLSGSHLIVIPNTALYNETLEYIGCSYTNTIGKSTIDIFNVRPENVWKGHADYKHITVVMALADLPSDYQSVLLRLYPIITKKEKL